MMISCGVSFFWDLSAEFLSLSLDPGGLYSWYLNFHTFAFWFFLCVLVNLDFCDDEANSSVQGEMKRGCKH